MSNNCSTPNLYDSLRFCDGTTVMPGIRRKAYIVSKALIVSFPSLPELDKEGVTMEGLAVLDGNFVLAADAKFKVIELDDTASNVSSESQGEYPSKSFLNKATFKHPGKAEEATGFCRLANGSDLIYIYQERDGKFRVLGNEMFRTNTKPAQESGAKETDASGTTLNVEVSDKCPAPFYVGLIPTDEGTIDASTGQLVVEEGE